MKSVSTKRLIFRLFEIESTMHYDYVEVLIWRKISAGIFKFSHKVFKYG